jgi:hypothetical protein
MDTTPSATAAHGLTLSKIRQLTAMIRNDAGTTYNDIAGVLGVGLSANSVSVVVTHVSGSIFDNSNYITTGGYIRGWVTVYYTD